MRKLVLLQGLAEAGSRSPRGLRAHRYSINMRVLSLEKGRRNRARCYRLMDMLSNPMSETLIHGIV
jgi:hypothetical protein